MATETATPVSEGYKQTEIGEIPESWEVGSPSDLTSRCASGRWGEGEASEGSIACRVILNGKVLKNTHIAPDLPVRHFTASEFERFGVQVDDCILVTSGAYVCNVARIRPVDVEHPTIASNFVRLLRGSNQLTSAFLGHALVSWHVQRQLESWVGGSAIPNLLSAAYSRVLLPLPPLPEQQAIAGVLESVDDSIQATQGVIEQQRVVKQGLLQQLLTRGIGHTKFKQTEIGEIPESWGVKMLGDVAAFRNGKGHERYIDDKGPFIVVNSKFISTEGAVLKRTEACLSPLSINDIAMVMSDVPKGRALSKCYRITENDCYTLNQRICAFETGEEITSDFLFLVVNRNSYFLRLDDGVGQTNLRRGEVLNCPIPLPSLPEQQAIADILQSVDDFIRAEEERLTQLETLKRGLMQDLLTGKVRVKVS